MLYVHTYSIPNTTSGPDLAYRVWFAKPCIRATKGSKIDPFLCKAHSLLLGGEAPGNEALRQLKPVINDLGHHVKISDIILWQWGT